ncbi:MAG: type I polyketide synthase [Rhizonema sp. PD37]|nr:type I polyketide synthase [Rhizonema sp. PD37]
MNSSIVSPTINGSEIAIISIAGRFPGAKNVEEFWQNLQKGVESISFFSDEELLSSGIEKAVLTDPNYVKARAVLEDVELFDASFFAFNPREAEVTDPQQRLFLECAWQAIENAGYNCETYEKPIGVYAGTSMNSYFFNLYSNKNLINSVDSFQLLIGSDKDFLTTRVSYKLNLEGPSYTVQTACSTSLVAVHLACQSLLNGECDMALAGGVSISASRKAGYFYKDGAIGSPDGHCRAFDVKAQGTVSGEGVGIVVLKRLEDALADGDFIHAVIKGSAINNDGAFKVSYTAPRIDTQAKVIRTAQVVAEVEPETITYLEAHGTGTSLGDPIEIAALTQAFRSSTEKKGFCAIGSVKTNIGHLDAAAGVTGLIKTVLALKHKQIPPSLHFEEPNPQIDFANSPFYVNTILSEWKTNGIPRRAGVSSFGIGGTNAHVILEEAPVLETSGASRPWQLLLLSAKTSTALETATAHLATHLKQHPDLNLPDVAYTLGVGRRAFDYRRILVCQNLEDAVTALSPQDQQQVFTHHQKLCNHRSVVFMFSGQGTQYVNMSKELYQSELIFKEQVDECSYLLKPHIGSDLRTVLYPEEEQTQQATQQLLQTAITQPALFVIEYALAQLWMTWGVQPEAMIGHSIGEYVAATLAGVFSLEEALALVAVRGRLMQQLPAGAMLAVPLSEKEIKPLLSEKLSLAGSNAPSLCVVSGLTKAVNDLQNHLREKGLDCTRLHTSHAFHSQMMDSIVEPFMAQVTKINLKAPQIPFVSNVTGTWITTVEATDPSYWARHLRQTVRFSEGIGELRQQPNQVFLEVGPGRTLSSFAKQHLDGDTQVVLSSLRHPKIQQSDVAFLLNTLGKLWLNGVQVNWSRFYAHERRHRIPLPTYPFEQQRYWIEPSSIGEFKASYNNDAQKTLNDTKDDITSINIEKTDLQKRSLVKSEFELMDTQSLNEEQNSFDIALENIMTQQLEIMSRQLDLLQME